MHIFWGSLVCVSILMFMREAFNVLLSLMSLESNEKLAGIRIYLNPLKMSLLLTFFGPTLEESGVIQQILRQSREGPWPASHHMDAENSRRSGEPSGNDTVMDGYPCCGRQLRLDNLEDSF